MIKYKIFTEKYWNNKKLLTRTSIECLLYYYYKNYNINYSSSFMNRLFVSVDLYIKNYILGETLEVKYLFKSKNDEFLKYTSEVTLYKIVFKFDNREFKDEKSLYKYLEEYLKIKKQTYKETYEENMAKIEKYYSFFK